MDIVIRPATVNDSEDLTEISFASKRYWNYPEEYIKVWKDELTIIPSYILNNTVYVAEVTGRVVGYFSLVEVKEAFGAGKVCVNKGIWLEHIFILPEYIGKGIGSKLIAIMKVQCKEMQIDKVNLFSDPHAKGFYDKLGACYIGQSPSSIEGRTVPLYDVYIS